MTALNENVATSLTCVNLRRYKFTLPKSDHSPGPVTERAIYGFAIYTISWVLFAVYFIWAFVPHEYLYPIGLTYLPSRIWAIAAPWAFILLIFTGVGIYLLCNSYLVHPLTSIHLLYDDTNPELSSVLHHSYEDMKFQARQRAVAFPPDSVVMAPTLDISLDWVNKQLYVHNPLDHLFH